MAYDLKEELEKLRDYLVKAVEPKSYEGWELRDGWTKKLAVINATYLLKEERGYNPVPLAWLESIEMPGLGDNLEGVMTWEDVYAHLLSKGAEESWSPSWGAQSSLQDWRHTRGQTYRVWHCWMDYGATGEGRTLHYRAIQAYDEIGVLHRILKEVNSYWAQGYDWSLDFPDNGVTQYLVSEALKKHVTSSNPGSMNCALEMHFNYS